MCVKPVFCSNGGAYVIPNIYNGNVEMPENCKCFQYKNSNICRQCVLCVNQIER